jgi:hypothetical protein
MNPIGIVIAHDLTKRHVNSAMPNAPVVADDSTRPGRFQDVRLAAASLLRKAADRVEPSTKRAVTYG